MKKAIQRKIDLYKEDLEEALPNLVKDSDAEIEAISEDELEAVEEELDTATNESVTVEVKQPLKESFNEDEFKRYMAAAEKLGIKTGADMMKFSKEHGDVKDKALLDAMEAAANELHEDVDPKSEHAPVEEPEEDEVVKVINDYADS